LERLRGWIVTLQEKKIGFIGAGKVGCSLGKYLGINGRKILGYYSKSPASAAFAAEFTGSDKYSDKETLAGEADILFLTVPDDEIEKVWESLEGFDLKGKILCHTSGSISSEVFKGSSEKGAFGASLHPLMAIPNKLNSYYLLPEAFFTVEGAPDAARVLTEMIGSMGNKIFPIEKNQKILYHLAASIVSNFSVALGRMGEEIFRSIGLSEALKGLFGLMLNNAKSVMELGPEKALTGPIERGDVGTIKSHLENLTGDDRTLYKLLGRKLIAAARIKNPERNYDALEELVSGE
jgi:predicted short-subunit dehydrogenase-like oxidoreductase (DUF2520 family)